MEKRIPTEKFTVGEVIKDELRALNWSQNHLAKIMKCSSQQVKDIISGKQGMTKDIADKLASAFGPEAQFWLNLGWE